MALAIVRVVVSGPGLGNVRSIVRAIARASSFESVVTSDPAALAAADYVVVPGQGAFGPFAKGVEGGLGDALREHIARERPYLGICLGMQVLFGSSEEAPGAAGLGVLDGEVARLAPGIDEASGRERPLPHIGWNEVTQAGTGARTFYYFAHSYAAVPRDSDLVTGTTEYGDATFASAVQRGAVMGVQFHPEKSQRDGLALLARFFGKHV